MKNQKWTNFNDAEDQMKIQELRDKIRKDMQDYKLLWTDMDLGRDESSNRWLFGTTIRMDDIRLFFSKYLDEQIDTNIAKLKILLDSKEENQNEK